MSLLKDVRPGVLSPDEAVKEHLIVNHSQDQLLHIDSSESSSRQKQSGH